MNKIAMSKSQVLRNCVWGGLCIAILASSIGVMRFLIMNGPKATTAEPVEKIVTVMTEPAIISAIQIHLKSQGEVNPRHRTQLMAQVGGKLSHVSESFRPGITFKGPTVEAEGELLLQVEKGDYEAAVAAANATLAEARLALTMEEAKRTQAVRDWDKIRKGQQPTELVRRVPQIRSAEARIRAAEAGLEKALQDLKRTEIRAPYDCRIERTYVDVGATVVPGVPLVELVSLGPVEIRLPLSLEDYGYLEREDGVLKGRVVVSGEIGGETVEWIGEIMRSEEIVERSTRSINVVAEFGGDGEGVPPIGMFVQASIQGKTISDAVRIPRSGVVDRDKVLLVENGRLAIRPAKVLWTESSHVIVRGGDGDGEIPGGATVVTTPPSPLVQNTRVREELAKAGSEGDSAGGGESAE
ncbi:MAG: efflux RND transporter periplasmic adaptor subunit [Roseibacillus sp.]|nr:efflux RND transporter periplasmic adaptor subunit [Roseibacillus sp.]